jgi:hypothetical protein
MACVLPSDDGLHTDPRARPTPRAGRRLSDALLLLLAHSDHQDHDLRRRLWAVSDYALAPESAGRATPSSWREGGRSRCRGAAPLWGPRWRHRPCRPPTRRRCRPRSRSGHLIGFTRPVGSHPDHVIRLAVAHPSGVSAESDSRGARVRVKLLGHVACPRIQTSQRARIEQRELVVASIEQLRSSDGWRVYLEARARFRSYSARNVLLILAQHPTATRVAGFRAWLDLGWCVTKGSTAIRIWAPCPPSKRQLQAWRDAGADPDAKPRTGWRLASVFDTLSRVWSEDVPVRAN